ncbi:hypothetical protein AJ79_06046 [Helicocarpus griseus UAMH5409]|uniref:MARVEL domain-containing protein n=1 Tax=Helicocarpus griseus UAMH5409 TaxID=1447875 RepID=A0A2B7XH69_9EURO|nr:hypothetical protein AJ79_06046 [Helicocarpus griseus UAMH5409]
MRPEESKNPVDISYRKIVSAGVIAWAFSIFEIVLATLLFLKSTGILAPFSAAFNLAVAALHAVLFFAYYTRLFKPASRSKPRPNSTFLATLAFSTVIWAGVFSLMFASGTDDASRKKLAKRKPKGGGGRGGGGGGRGAGGIGSMESLVIAGGVLGAIIFITTLVQWYYVYKLCRVKFSRDDIQTSAALRLGRGWWWSRLNYWKFDESLKLPRTERNNMENFWFSD